MTGNFAPPAADHVAGRTEAETNASGSSALRRGVYFTSLGLAGLGALDSAYLTYVKFAGAHAACAGIGDCETVNNSAFSAIAGVPIAILGLALIWQSLRCSCWNAHARQMLNICALLRLA